MKKTICLLLIIYSMITLAEEKINYVESKSDIACFESFNYSLDGMAECYESQAKKVEKQIKQKIKPLNKNSQYDLNWFNKEKQRIINFCKQDSNKNAKKIGETNNQDYLDSDTQGCIRNELATLNKKLK